MEKEKVFEILVQAAPSDIAPLAAQFRDTVPYSVIKEPKLELVMFQAEESVEKLDFNVGEILVSSAEVRVGNSIGYSMVMDLDETKALDCAIILGIYEAGLPQVKDIEILVEELDQKMMGRLKEEMEIIGSTAVNFELMGGQDPNIKHNINGES
ncbi:phosphonate C-P lyase system protein PhnG [bacterium]|nr:phosphonate C-P lyase system protein PhnG [bacterium]